MNRYAKGLIFLPVLLLTGCPSNGPTLPPPVLGAKYSCLSTPSAAFQAGSVIRNVKGLTVGAAAPSPDALTIAYLPTGPASYSGAYPDFEKKVLSGMNAALTAKKLEKLGVTLNLSGAADYSVTLEAKGNKTYVADDDVLFAVSERMRAREGLISEARYFFVKEAVGSQELTYMVTNKLKVEANAKLTADSSGLAVNLPIRDASNKLSSTKELIACVVLEEIELKVVSAANGVSQLSLKRKPAPPADETVAILSESIEAR